jgi:GTP-binding protein
MYINSATFITSASKVEECPVAQYPEFAFVGRSNVGKSSLINMLAQRKISKVSATPGKTQLMNFFLINDARYLVDLPGYGYAKYNKEDRTQWMDTMQDYLIQRASLKLVFLLIDGSILPQQIDLDFMQVLQEEHIPFVIIMTKTDKCTQKDLHKHLTLLQIQTQKILHHSTAVFQVSNTKNKGKEQILEYIQEMIA